MHDVASSSKPLHRALIALASVSVFALLAWGLGSASRAADPALAQVSLPRAEPEAELELTTVILIRHAEKDTARDPRDPGLSAAGSERAQRLARMLRHAGVTHLFASEFKRTRETLAPLASEIGRDVRVVPAAEAEELVRSVRELPPGSVAVVAGHSNTLPRLVELFGGTIARVDRAGPAPALDDAEYGRMFILELLPAAAGCRVKVSTRELAYGD